MQHIRDILQSEWPCARLSALQARPEAASGIIARAQRNALRDGKWSAYEGAKREYSEAYGNLGGGIVYDAFILRLIGALDL